MWRIIDIGGFGYSLKSANNKLIVSKDDFSSEISFRDINSIIIHCDCQITGEVFRQCLANCIPIVFCDEKHIPSGLFSSFNQNEESARRFEIQLSASKPKMKQAWMQIIREKLKNQAYVLEYAGQESVAKELSLLSKGVLSGDSSNREAVGAKLYFPALMGTDFSRGNDELELNGILNYGYTIIRALIARVVSGLGLYPGFSIFHSNKRNPYAFIDDMMEPIRPLVDKKTLELRNEGVTVLDSATKRKLMEIINTKTRLNKKDYELIDSLQIMVMSYIRFIEGKDSEIAFPYLWV